jgi:hypothetical protein
VSTHEAAFSPVAKKAAKGNIRQPQIFMSDKTQGLGASVYAVENLDHTASHLNRGAGDLMRYAALLGFAESSDFGPYHMLTAEQRTIEGRLPDEALYALALYIQSLKQMPRLPDLSPAD